MPKKIRTLPLRPTHGPILRATKPKLPPVDDGSAWSPLDLWLFQHELGKLADDEGDPVVFVLTRQGLRWRLTDIRLPL